MNMMLRTAVDLFAGCGGSTTGATAAGVRVLVAANHWPDAVETHRLNHPDTHHLCQDLQQANFFEWPDFDLLMASPACQGHSRARGADRAHHDACRSTAWAVVACAEAKRPKALVVENVPEFTEWALYPEWRRCLEKLGYALHVNVLDSADFGVPQHRRRVFITGRLGGEPVVVTPPRVERKAASTVVNWEAGPWSEVRKPGRAEATLRRYEVGRRELGERFLLAYYGSERGGRSLANPLGTVLTRDRYALVNGGQMRMLQVCEYKTAMGFPAHYRLPGKHKLAVHMLGNSVVPAVMEAVVRSFEGKR